MNNADLAAALRSKAEIMRGFEDVTEIILEAANRLEGMGWQPIETIPHNRFVIVKLRQIIGRLSYYSGRIFASRYIPETDDLQLYPGCGASLDWVAKWHEIPPESEAT